MVDFAYFTCYAKCMFAQKGQILLVVILVIIISSTIGLSVASRSITNIRTATEEAESQKALSAAEAGIERTIQSTVPIAIDETKNPSNNSSYLTKVTPVKSSSFLINGGSTILDAAGAITGTIPNTVPKAEGADVWFVDHNANGDAIYSSAKSTNFLNLYWGTLSSEGCSNINNMPAAIQVIVVTRNPSPPNEVKSYRYVYDSCNRGNNFTKSEDAGNYAINGAAGIKFKYKTPKNHLAKGVKDVVLMRVVPIYRDAVIGLDTCNPEGNNCEDLPSQGYIISSTGTSGQANRKITVFKGYQQTYLPYLSYGLFVAN